MINAEARVRNLAALGRDLHNSSTALLAQLRYGRADSGLVRKIEHRHRQAVAMLRLQIGEGALTAYSVHSWLYKSQ